MVSFIVDAECHIQQNKDVHEETEFRDLEWLLLKYWEEWFSLEVGEVEKDALVIMHHDETPHQINAIPNNFKLLLAFAREHCQLPGC